MNELVPCRPGPTQRGMTLVELVVAMAVSAVLVSGAVRLALASTAGFRLQQTLASLQESGRFLGNQLQDAIRPAGYHPEPWRLSLPEPAIGEGSASAVGLHTDRLELRRWSDRNCFDNPNPDTDAAGRPRYFLRITRFEVRNGNLALHCRYGPDMNSLVTQANQLGLTDGVEAFAVRFAEDGDGDGRADRWVEAGEWIEESRVLGVRYALILAGPQPVAGVTPASVNWLAGRFVPPDDGRLRRLLEGTVVLAGRRP